MTYSPGRHIYLAAGFFNDEQRELCSFIESFEDQRILIYSPRNDGGVLKPDSSLEEISIVFESNKNAIYLSSWMLAVIDNFDTGVIWEMGYGHARNVPILGYSDVPGRGLNVMLAGACNLGFVNGREDLTKVMNQMGSGDIFESLHNSAFPRNTWSGEIQ